MYNSIMYAKRSWRLLTGAILEIKFSPVEVASRDNGNVKGPSQYEEVKAILEEQLSESNLSGVQEHGMQVQ